MLEREAQEQDREARERGENPAQAGWTDAGTGEGEITGSEVPDGGGPHGAGGIREQYGQ